MSPSSSSSSSSSSQPFNDVVEDSEPLAHPVLVAASTTTATITTTDTTTLRTRCPLQEDVEMAYLLLDDCYSGFRIQTTSSLSSSSISNHKNTHHHSSSAVPTFHQWLPVKILPKMVVQESNDSSHPPPAKPLPIRHGNDSYDDTDDCCHRCHLVVTKNRNDDDDDVTDEYSIDWNHIVPFHGTMCDLPCGVHDGRPPRSDAALLMGLLAACDPQQIHIVRCYMMFVPHHSSIEQPQQQPTQRQYYGESHHNDNDHVYYGSILVTLAFPQLRLSNINDDTNQFHCYRRSIVADISSTTINRKKLNSKAKALDPALQLLLTLIRSDWDQYEVRKEQILIAGRQSCKNLKPKVSFFPSSLTLSSMYQRMQPQQQRLYTLNAPHLNHNDSDETSNDNSCHLTSLPLDILHRKLVQPYLDASTLAALRCTCHYLYDSLRSIVPGLKLQLYRHQVNSLHWMRQRETSRIRIESDCFEDDRNTSTILNETGDIHRAITGGASVKLCTSPFSIESLLPSRHEPSSEIIYLDPYTGIEILPNDIRQWHELRRNVACGGLLCDDPGLGKTITVLALILQTPILAPQQPQRQEKQQAALSNPMTNELENLSEDETLFEMYWSEEISSDFREPYLLKLFNDFCKRIPSAFGTHFPINEIRKSISEDRYASKFAEFDAAVRYVSNTFISYACSCS